jgi:acyl-CoA synthetase (AMP-forming)/AMP-acid ligase II
MIYSGGPITSEVPNADLTSFALQRANVLATKPALVEGPTGRTVTYGELERSVRALAAGLVARGFAKGDTFAIYMSNVPEYAVAFHGVLSVGGRCTTVNPLYTARELADQIRDAGARMMLTSPPFLEAALEAGAAAECEVFVLGDDSSSARPFSDLFGDPANAPDTPIDGDDIAAILYSSGTTGLAKGVMLSHRNLIVNMIQSGEVLAVQEDEVTVAVLPFFHVYGLVAILNHGLLAGATIVTMPRFELEQFLSVIERYRATRAYVVPPIALALARDPSVDGCDLSALRHILCAAAPLGDEIQRACSERIGCPVTQGYGMTEMSPITHLVPPFGSITKPGSVGLPVPGTECRLVDPATGVDVGPGEPGELWMRGPQVMKGYLNNQAATAGMIDEDGWLHSGDIAVADEDGWFSIVDRVKELIKVKGFQVAPAELEAILLGHPGIADCAVIGVPDERCGELPKAFVVPAVDELDVDAVMRYVAEQVAPHKRLRHIEVIDVIPKSPSGKILRRTLRDRTPTIVLG